MGHPIAENRKPGDIVDVQMIIVGWGPREVVDQMKSLVFTAESPYKQYETWVKAGHPGDFPQDPIIDAMDEWYESLKKRHSK